MFREDNNSCKIDDDEEEDNGNCFVVISDFDACQKSDLTVRKDDIVTVINHDFRNNERNSGSVIANRRNSQNKILVRKCDQTRNQGLVPENILLPLFEEISQNDAFSRRKAVIDELIETEIEFITDLKFVVENYLRPASIKLVPKIIKENFQMLFGNLKEILEFHNTVVLEAVRYYATDPNLMGRAFIRLEREFDKHVRYCRDEPQAQQFLRSIAEVGAFFENLRRKLSIEDKGLSVHLKLPIQRINDYQLLFRELIRYSEILNENTNDLQRAYELMLNVPNRAEDDKFLDSIEGFRGNLHKFGRLIAHDWFSIKSGNDRLTDQPVKERYLFLFKGVILITKVKRISDNRSIFQFKESFKLQDLQFRDRTDNFEFEIIKNDNDDDDEDNRKSLLLISHRDETKTVWLNEIKKFATEFVDNNRSKVVSMSEPEEDKQTMSQNYSYKTSTTRSYYANRASLGEIQESSSSARQNYSTYTSRSKTISATSGDQLLKEVSESEPNNKNKRLPATIEEETAGDVVNIGKERRQRVLLKRLLKPCNVIPGENAIFEISFAEKYTKVNWLKDNRKFDENLLMRTSETHLDDSNTYQLEIRDCLSADSGIYTAIATTADGQEKSLSTTQLIVNDKNTIEIDDKSPIFTIKLKNIALLERTHLCFLVKVKGDPVPTVNFYKNNQLIDGSDDNMHIIRESASKGTYELFIDTVKYSDAGTYKCVAENVYGKDECECELTVTDHKDIFGELADAELLGDGEAATFTWKRDGKEFEPDERFKVLLGDDDDSLALIFQHVKPDDAGLYTCVAQTSNGRISCSAELTVQGAVHELHREPEKPMLEHVAVENVVTSGSVAVLEMKIKGYPKPEVTWTHDGEVIEPSGKYKFLYEDQESMSLMIKNVENRDSGMYQVSATNELGSDSKEIRLSVKSGPKIVTDLQDLKLLRDQKFELVIEVEGVPKPNVKIYKDGQELSSGECLQIDSENNRYRIKIKKVSNENAGSYSIVATNEISQASKFWKMSVESKPEVREAFDKYYEYELGKDVQIQCKIDANPKAEVKWFKHGKEIQDERYIIKEDDNCYMLRITGSVETDSDTYKVLAKNIHGSTEIGTSLVLKREPKITKGLKDLVANESDRNVELDVEVEAYPKPQIKWYLDEVEISESRTEFTRIESDNGAKLVIKEVTSGLAGKYCCRVINEMGETETSAKLTVQCKPRILKHLNNTTVEEGATLNLGIEVCANPEPAVKWLRNGKEITTDTRIRIVRNTERYETYDLIVDLVKYEDGGNYEVVVQNSLGTVSSKSTVIVQKMQMCDTLEETDEKHETDTDRETEQKGHVKSSDDVLDAIEDMNDIEEEFQERNEEFVEVDQISYEPEQTERCTQNDTGDENTIIDTGTEGIFNWPAKEINWELFANENFLAEPIITGSNINDGKIVESADIEYKVQVCGSPVPIVTWMANKEVLQNDSRVAISQNGDEHKLLIKKARMDDAGIYQCRIKNNKGEIVQKAKLTVIPEVDVKRPIVIEHLKDASLKKSQDICLKLVLTSDSTPEFKWSLDGRPIQFSRNAIQMEFKDIPDEHIKEFTYLFHVYNCDISDSGMYKVLISNKFGECESDCKIEIVAAPVINGEKSVTGSLGNDTELAVEVKSVPPATIKWTKNGKVIDTDCGKYAVVSEPPLQKLIIKNVDLEDIGSYAVLAVNPEGESEHRISVTSDCEKPCFVKELSANCTIDDGDSVKLRVRCNGVPLPALRWFLNEQPLTDNGATCQIKTSESNESVVSEIELENSDLLNTAQIKCVAENVAGTATTVCQIAINQSPPIILRRLDRNVSLGEDQPLELVAKVTGSPKPEVKWFKDGKPIDECSGDFKTIELPDGVVKLTLEKATVKDAGTFKLLVKNMSGEATGVASVSVEAALQKPEFLKSLEDIEAVEGEQLKLEAIVKANPMPEIKWMKDGSPVKNAPNVRTAVLADGLVRFEIETLKADQAGIYSLVVSNSLGESAQSAKISVQQKAKKPGFLSDLSPFSKVVESFPAKFSVQTTGFPPPKVQWYLNNEPIEPVPGKIEITNEPDGTSSLVVQQCTLNDAGVYEAVAENECGKSSQKCELKVTPKCNQNEAEEVPMFLSELKDIEIDEGETLKLEAVIAGNPIPEIKWSRNGKCLENALKSCDGRKAHLVLDKVTLADSGSFCCALQNGKGSAKSECNVIVRKTSMAPSFIEKLNDVQQVPGHNAILQVKIAGKPQPTVAWFKENQPIADTSKYYIKSDGNLCQLHVRDCDGLDSGQYKCQIANSEGQSSCCASLNVVDKIKSALKTEPANFLKRITDLDLYPEMTAKFTACASGIPDPTIEWFHNGKPLFNAGRYRIECDKGGLLRLTIADVSDSDLGEYTCKASNASGSDTCTAKLTFDSFVKRPKKPSLVETMKQTRSTLPGTIPQALTDAPYITRMSDRNVTLSWRPLMPMTYREPITYRLEMCEMPGDDSWRTVWTNIRSCTCGVRDLKPNADYKFRVRTENKYGMSEPSPYVMTYRQKFTAEPKSRKPYLGPDEKFDPKTSFYFPKDFDLERPSLNALNQAPVFLRQERDRQFGVKDQNSSLFWYVYGYPRPVMSYYFNGEPIESGGRFDFSYTRNGQATLFINKMLDRDAGIYEAVAKNDFGEARQTLRFDFAEIPYFMRRPDIQCSRSHGMARFEARIAGIPKPEIRWYKDWKLLSSSTRLTFDEIENDTYVLTIRDLIQKDEGLYSISATNIAGTVSHSVMLYVEDNDHDYEFRTYTNIRPLSIKKQLFSDFYELGEELGRGTQGITYHAVNRSTGINYAAKIMHGRDELRRFMYNEYDAMNNLHHRKLVRLHDVYENDDSFILVMELAGGGQLVRDYLIKRDYYYESEISSFVRQSLLALDYMHSSGYAHLGLNIGDILLSHIGGHDLKLADFGLARKIFVDNLADLKYGMPDYVSPEIANGSSVSYKSDSWTIGIITYILLSGRSPFLGENDRETLTRIRHGEWTFDDFYWSNISSQAKDFISKLLVYKSDDRLSIREALDHPWVSGMNWKSDYQISSEYLRKYYYDYYANWYDNASCRTWYRRRRLSLAYEHPSHMVYPPYEVYTPSDFDCYRHNNWRNRSSKNKTNPDSDSNFEPMDLSYDIGVIKSESHYQNGPDTYLLQLRDVDFPVRLREYMKVAASRSHSPNRSYATSADFDRSLPSIRERRRFTDIMDEEIEDERKKRIKQYGSDEVYSLRRLRHELGTRLDTYVEAEAMLGSRLSGQAPFFREKPTITVIVEGEQTQISCLAIGDPKPVIQWFKNDAIIVSEEHQRISVQEDSDGRSLLCFRPASIYDIGLYKAVARNKLGQTVARARVVMGSVPDPPQAPKIAQISDTEILLTWNQPKDFGHSPVICFKLQYKQAFRNDWKDLKSNIDHEFYCVRNLEPEKSYVFRLATRNKIGWSSFSLPTNAVETKRPDDGHDKIKMSNTMISLQQMTDSDQTIHFDSAIKLDYSLETNLMSWICDANQATENYTFLSEIYRGQFSTVLKGVHQTSNEFVVAKILEMRPEVENEFEVLRTLRHQKIASLIEAYKSSTIAVFILEKLQGADVLSYLATRLEYSEQVVANIVLQILNALQYMHWRGFCHLNIQPDNIVMCSVRTAQIKLVDMGSAKAVSRLGTAYPKIECHRDFISPEMLSNESLFPQTDIWSLGVLTYLMLSGTVPFDSGEDDHERSQNIIYVRYRFENLYKDISQESIRFLMSIFKRSPGKRPTCEECLENRWFQPTDFMIRKREKAVFSGENLRKYSENYHNEKSICSNESVCKIIAKTLSKSQSIQDELITFSK